MSTGPAFVLRVLDGAASALRFALNASPDVEQRAAVTEALCALDTYFVSIGRRPTKL